MMHLKTTELKNLQLKAQNDNIPILSDDGLLFLVENILNKKVNHVLEIGTATGYSAIAIASLTGVKVTTVERDEARYLEAVKNVKAFNLENQITLILKDALELEVTGTFDCIFIDAAKAQYEKFFNKYEKNLSPNGFIITDNLNFHNLDISKVSRSTRNLIKRLESFKTFLKDNRLYKTTFTDIGDGMSVSERIIK
jgi:predicted O-methyltransferase YrrM